MKKILFYIAQEYYWASLKPIYDEFAKEDGYELFIKIGKNQKRFLGIFLLSQRKRIEQEFIKNGYQLTKNTLGFDVVFCGAQLKKPKQFGNALLCNIDHGPGIKTLRYRHLKKQKDVKYICFLEGQYRIEKFKKYGLDKIHEIYDVGLPKLDVFFNGTYDKATLMKKYHLDTNKNTVLYAPSYKPTSIFTIGEEVLRLSDKYNVIVKLHPYSWSGKYAPHSQHRFFEKRLKKYPNVHLVEQKEHNILPYMFVSDTMISDGSSVINEFLALGRCGIIFNLPKEIHRDGTPLLEDESSQWLKDSFVHINSGDDLFNAVEMAINPDEKRMQNLLKDRQYIFSYTDGKSAYRVKEIIKKKLEMS